MTATSKHPKKISATRRLTICSKGFPRRWGAYINFLSINLSGKWLQENGFKIGHVVDIKRSVRFDFLVLLHQGKNFKDI